MTCKTRALIIVIALILLAGCAQYSEADMRRPEIDETRYDDYEIVYIGNMGESTLVKSIDYIDERAQYIFRGYLMDDGEEIITKIPDTNLVIEGGMLYTLVVTDVIRGSLKKGEEIPFIDSWYMDDVSGVMKIYCQGSYTPSIPGVEYLFFTIRHEQGKYDGIHVPVGTEYGRYPLIDSAETNRISAMTAKELNVGERETKEYKAVYADVIEKYGSKMKK